MVETITPVVHGGRGRWVGALALHAIGATVTAGAFGAVLGVIGLLVGAPFGRAGLVAIVVVAVAYAVAELPGVQIPVPQLRRQVPDWWRTFFGRSVAAALYGAGLGVGFGTYLTHGTLVIVALAAFGSGRPAIGALLMAPFGLVRGLSVASAWDVTTPERGRALVGRLAAIPDRSRRVGNAVALGVVAVAALALAGATAPAGWWELGAAALASVFAWAGASKLVASRRWRRSLEAHDLPGVVRSVARWAVPVAEALVPALVVADRPRSAAAWAFVLVAAFTVELIWLRRRNGDRVPCGCFGGRVSIQVTTVLGRNAALAAVAIVVVVAGTDAGSVRWPGVPAPLDLLPATLAIAGLMVAAVTGWRAMVWLGPGRRPR